MNMIRICIGLSIFLVASYLYMNIISPFIIALIFASLFEPLIVYITRKIGLSRPIVATCLFFLIIISLIIIILTIMPMLYDQIVSLAKQFPKYKVYFQDNIIPNIAKKLRLISPDAADQVSEGLSRLSHYVFSDMQAFTLSIWQYTMSTISFVGLVIIFPVLLFYFMRDFDNISSSIQEQIPKKYSKYLLQISSGVNNVLKSYLKGQLYVSVILIVYYSIGLELIGVNFALLIGVATAVLIIIPLIGFIAALSISMMICYFQFGSDNHFAYLCLLYIFGYCLESWFLTPKIIGDEIGLHPLWILFSVLICGSVFGFLGLIFAIPIAGIIKVLLKTINQQNFYEL